MIFLDPVHRSLRSNVVSKYAHGHLLVLFCRHVTPIAGKHYMYVLVFFNGDFRAQVLVCDDGKTFFQSEKVTTLKTSVRIEHR